MIKKTLIVILLLAIVYAFYRPIIINCIVPENGFKKNIIFKKNKSFKLRDILKLEENTNLKLYLVVKDNYNDFLNIDLRDSKILKLNSESLIKDFLDVELIYNDSDVSTIENRIYIYSNDELIFESEISLELKSVGLQNKQLGWVTPNENKKLVAIFDKLQRYNYPILILN